MYPQILLPVGVLSCFLLVRMRIAKWFKNSSKRFRCKAMFESEHTPSACEHNMFAFYSVCAASVSSVLAKRATWLECYERGRECLLHGGGPLLISFVYCSTLLFLSCVLNGSLCMRVVLLRHHLLSPAVGLPGLTTEQILYLSLTFSECGLFSKHSPFCFELSGSIAGNHFRKYFQRIFYCQWFECRHIVYNEPHFQRYF
jgi:hypothetical protein